MDVESLVSRTGSEPLTTEIADNFLPMIDDRPDGSCIERNAHRNRAEILS
jgi:hypothetical protein